MPTLLYLHGFASHRASRRRATSLIRRDYLVMKEAAEFVLDYIWSTMVMDIW